MLKEIEFIGDYQVGMYKKLYAPNEIALANCMNFIIEYEGEWTVVKANLFQTSKRAMFEFIKECFRNLMHNPDVSVYKNAIFEKLSDKYNEIYAAFDHRYLSKAPYRDTMMAHQRDAVCSCVYRKHTLLAFEQGLGKTMTSATISRVMGIKRTVIICPSIVKWNWFRELTEKWGFNELYFSIFDANKSRCIQAFQERFVIVNYEMVNKYMDKLCASEVGHIIIDECTGIKNANSGKFKAVHELVNRNHDAKITLLSGTPVKNRVNDVFAYLKLTGHPLGDNYAAFLRDYTLNRNGKGGTQVTGGRNLSELFVKMSNFMIRRTKAECLDLPDKIISKYHFKLDDYKEEYDRVVQEIINNKESPNLNSSLHSLNIVLAKSKLKGIIEMAESILDQERKVVIFSSYKEPLKMLEHHFKESCVLIDGSVDAKNRDTLIQKFLNDDKCTVFLGNMIAAGVGINLVNSSDTIFVNFPFTPSELYQAEDRQHRLGQKNNVNIYYTICEDSIDEYLYDLIANKAADINNLIDRGKEAVDFGSIPDLLYKQLLKNYNVETNETVGTEVQHNEDDTQAVVI